MKTIFTKNDNLKYGYIGGCGLLGLLIIISIFLPLFQVTFLGESITFGFFNNNESINYALFLPIILGLVGVLAPIASLFVKVNKDNAKLFNLILPLVGSLVCILALILFYAIPTHTELNDLLNTSNAIGAILITLSLVLGCIAHGVVAVMNFLKGSK